jgi:MoxR-like ATPase
VRLQCYEGIDAAEALYEWNYPRQLLSIRLAEAGGSSVTEADLFRPEYLIRRPLLQALEHPGPRPAVLLIDEIDRADDDFEAFLLELLAEAAVTIPELGTIRATHPPVIVLTSNRTRDLADAVSRLRDTDVQKPPGIAEAIDWLSALELLGVEALDAAVAGRTLGSVLKYEEDQELVRAAGLDDLVARRG